MVKKNYSEGFCRQAVDLYESTPGTRVRGIAEDLGVVRGTLRGWLEVYGTRKKTAVGETLTASQLRSRLAAVVLLAQVEETPEQKIARFKARVNELEIETTKLITEREIAAGSQVFRRGDALVSRFQFVADNSSTYSVKRL